MVYFAIIIFYCTLFTVGSYMFIKRLRDIELQYLKSKYNLQIKELEGELESLKEILNKEILKARQQVVEENRSYLSSMNTEISYKFKELSDNIKNRPII